MISAPFVKQSGLEIIPVGYMLVDGGTPTTAKAGAENRESAMIEEVRNFLNIW